MFNPNGFDREKGKRFVIEKINYYFTHYLRRLLIVPITSPPKTDEKEMKRGII